MSKRSKIFSRKALARQKSGRQRETYWAGRKLLPGFARLQAVGAFKPKKGTRSIEEIIDEVKADVSV